MSFGIATKVEVIGTLYQDRWIYAGEKGEIVGGSCSPAGEEIYRVELENGGVYMFSPGEIEELDG